MARERGTRLDRRGENAPRRSAAVASGPRGVVHQDVIAFARAARPRTHGSLPALPARLHDQRLAADAGTATVALRVLERARRSDDERFCPDSIKRQKQLQARASVVRPLSWTRALLPCGRAAILTAARERLLSQRSSLSGLLLGLTPAVDAAPVVTAGSAKIHPRLTSGSQT